MVLDNRMDQSASIMIGQSMTSLNHYHYLVRHLWPLVDPYGHDP